MVELRFNFIVQIDDSLPVCRGTWFTGTSSLDTWQPLGNDDSEQIEKSHQSMLRAMVSQSAAFAIVVAFIGGQGAV